MEFIQIIEFRTSKLDEMLALEQEWLTATEGNRTLGHSYITRDRSDPELCRVIAVFESYESAMENSNLPETTAFGEKMAALADGPPTFIDLDVIERHG